MHLTLSKNVIGGVLLLLIGFAVGWYSLSNYDIGSISGMGPGMLPLIMASILVLCGLGCLIVRDAPEEEPLDIRALALIIGSILSFAATVEALGLFPAVAALVAIASLAHRDRGLRRALILTVFLSIAAAAIFVFGLGLPLKLVT